MMKRSLLSTLVIFSMQISIAEEAGENLENLQASGMSASHLYSFDARSLFGGSSQDIDLSKFTSTDAIAAGVYSLTTSVNNRSLGQLTLQFKHLDASRSAVLCIDDKLLQYLDLRKDILEQLPKVECLTIKNLSPDAYYDADLSTLSLSMSLPLVILNNRPSGYIAPELFERGVTAAFLGYDFNTYQSKSDGYEKITSNYLSLNGGLNIGGLNFRHSGSFNGDSSSLGDYQSYLNTVSTDILPLKSRLTAGEFNTQTYYIDSAQIVGAQLASDIGMRPMSQRSYAPVIKGVANTNALVTVFQNGRKVYERTVPAGDFEINDLNAISNNGDLTVQVTENGGEKYSFIVPLQGSMNIIRIGQFNYSAAVGKYKLNNKISDDYISQFSFEYGLSNYVSLYAGTNISNPFKSYLLGVGTNTHLGGIKFDVEHSNATLANNERSGQKYQTAYQYNYAPLGTSISLGAQYQSREYMTLSNTMAMRNLDNLDNAEIDNIFRTYRLKQQFNISMHQSLKENKYGSVYLSASKNNYWNSSKDFFQYSIGYSNNWKKIGYSLSLSQSATDLFLGNKEKKVYMSFTLPLDFGSKRASVYSSIQHSDLIGKPTSASLGLSGVLGESNQFNYGLNTNNYWSNDHSSSSISTNINYKLPQVQLGAVAGWRNDQTQYGMHARGAFVAHRYGLTATNTLSDTFTIIHADGAKGAGVSNAWGTKIDRFGNAVFSNLSPYEINTVSLDLKNLPVNLNFKSNQAEVIPRRFSTTMVEFKAVKTSNILLNVKFDQGQKIPIGAYALNTEQKPVGMFGQSNQLFIENTVDLENDIQVLWGESNQYKCQIEAPEKLVQKTKTSKAFQVIDVECK
ncbi:fimbria/pilus outer membrane usher protein [Acinetobacter pullicarnis]|uniref:fimbria/pilus outer membrane usher protein n=1 Tax=Acinetobacter pullicarnis TaxID=2576829 RepID=UPI001E49FC51|nr:fimbria/pilus outer membrane usher protein [Acinetobacter pullicarnis]